MRNLVIIKIVCLSLFVSGCSSYQEMASDKTARAPHSIVQSYRRAEAFLNPNVAKVAYNNDVQHHWISGTKKLWFKKTLEQGHEYIIAVPERQDMSPAFNHEKMALALGKSLEQDVEASKLPIDGLVFDPSRPIPDVMVFGKVWRCNLEQLTCEGVDMPSPEGAKSSAELPTPNGSHFLIRKDYNLWMRDGKSGQEIQLTKDGTEFNQYGQFTESSTSEITLRRMKFKLPPVGIFSPDGDKFLTYQLDQSKVKPLQLLQNIPEDGSLRPIVHQYRYPFPGDAKPTARLVIIDIKTGALTFPDLDPLEAAYLDPILKGYVSWSQKGDKIYVLSNKNSKKTLSYHEIDVESGKSRVLISEDSAVFNFPYVIIGDKSMAIMLENGDFLWPSERSGWRHLYRYDGQTGKLKNQVTSGSWMVRELIKVDEKNGVIYFTAVDRKETSDPYFRVLYKVNLDGTNLTRLTPEDADHQVTLAAPPLNRLLQPGAPGRQEAGFSLESGYFVVSSSRPDQPGRTVIRDLKGKYVMTLAEATLSKEMEDRYVRPEIFQALAADGKTPVYGTIFKPGDFDPNKTYPVIDSVYPGPQINRVTKRFLSDPMQAQAIAELGFIVVTVDGRGTPMRSRAFRDVSYGNLASAGYLEDHISAIEEIASTRPYMDINRVGVYGTSGGGFATVRAMFDYPDFYKVGVASSGNHDQRIYISLWGESYQGPYSIEGYATANSYENVANFKGDLLIAHGEMDDNVHPANSMRVVDALIKHNKRFDMLIMPNVNHGIMGNPYYTLRLWDYFVEHLLKETPPENYSLTPPGQAPASE